jgi:hypothetical protein
VKLTLTILFALCLAAQAQTNLAPLVDTNALAKTRALVASIQATNLPVVVPMDTNIILTYPMNYPAGFPVGANVMYSTNCQQWIFARSFDITKSNSLSFTNPASEPHFWCIVLMPPHVLSISNSVSTTN